MNNQRKSRPALPPPADLARMALRLVEPSRFNTGLTFPDIELPRGIRVFVRTRIGYGGDAAPNMNLVKHILIANLRGAGEIILDGVPMEFHQSEALIIRPDQFHHYARSRRNELVWLFIGFDLKDDMLASFAQHGPLPLEREDWGYLRQILADYLADFSQADGADPEFAAALGGGRMAVMLWLLLINLAERQRRFCLGAGAAPDNPGNQALVKKTQAYLLEHLRGPIHIQDVARNAGVSPTRLCQVFQAAVGRSLGRTIRQLRINRAAMLLAESGLEVKEAAAACGFSSVSAFCRTFRQVVGMTPKHYRALRQAGSGGSRHDRSGRTAHRRRVGLQAKIPRRATFATKL